MITASATFARWPLSVLMGRRDKPGDDGWRGAQGSIQALYVRLTPYHKGWMQMVRAESGRNLRLVTS
jgi:hypothetical protein